MMKVYISIPKGDVFDTFVPSQVQTYLEQRFQVDYSPYERQLTPEEFAKAVRDCDAVFTGWGHPVITYDMVKDSNIKVIAHTGGTVAMVADPSLYQNGIKVISGNLLYAESVAEGVIAYMLTGLRRIPYYVETVRQGGWHGTGFFSEGLLDQTVGIVGFGTISRILIEMLQIFRVKIKVYSSHAIDSGFLKEYHACQAPLNEIFSTCKIVSVHSAMTEKTRGMIGKEQFDLLQDGALFVNTARGGVIREEEMIAALRENRFSAVLDVYCEEPLAEDSPLRSFSNAYCMPHMGGPTLDRRPYITKKIADNLMQFEKGAAMELEIKSDVAKRMTSGM